MIQLIMRNGSRKLPREGNIGECTGVEPSLLSDGDVETALPYLVFHIAFVLFAQVVEYFAQQEPQSVGGDEVGRVGHIVAVVGNVERGAIAVSRVFAGVGVAAA